MNEERDLYPPQSGVIGLKKMTPEDMKKMDEKRVKAFGLNKPSYQNQPGYMNNRSQWFTGEYYAKR
jgi:hypothetical protein